MITCITLNILTHTQILIPLLATGEKWVNELANFQFFVNFKPGIKNNVEETLNRFPKSSRNREEYGKICSVRKLEVFFYGSINQINGEETWIPVVINITVKG